MKKIFVTFFLFFLIGITAFSEEWISEKGQKLTFINLTAIKFNENSLEKIGTKITRWKNANMYLNISSDGNIICEINIIPDNYDVANSTEWIAWLYNWFITNIADEDQATTFMSLGFYVRYRTVFERGTIEQYAALRRSGYVKFYNDMHFEAGDYKADNNDFSWLYPNYDEETKNWNSGYLYRYIIGDFDAIKDMPVPPGLDDSFKKKYNN